MEPSRGLTCVMIGAGNVASSMAPALERSGRVRFTAVYSRSLERAGELAGNLAAAVPVADMDSIPVDADLYLVAVKDDAIGSIVSMAPRVRPGAVWAHTSGSVDAAVFAPVTSSYGVFYPLQTFSRGVSVDWRQIPVFVEGTDVRTLGMLRSLAGALSDRVYEADGAKRGKLHAAAVFACNFVNHLWAVADDILHREAGVDLSVLRPLIEETVRKSALVPPAQAQTGPAVRGDTGVMRLHMQMLSDRESALYKMLSQSIMDYYNIT